jgi:hypothetical protein
MALEDLEGKGSFWKVLEVFAKKISGWKLWRERTRAPMKLGNFSGFFFWIFGVFGVVRT